MGKEGRGASNLLRHAVGGEGGRGGEVPIRAGRGAVTRRAPRRPPTMRGTTAALLLAVSAAAAVEA